jgi:hypothetical protein
MRLLSVIKVNRGKLPLARGKRSLQKQFQKGDALGSTRLHYFPN